MTGHALAAIIGAIVGILIGVHVSDKYEVASAKAGIIVIKDKAYRLTPIVVEQPK